ncbi:MAG: beta-lactamase family protein [Planctomycetes bacterium]|nr:beta-lactamase family protein [Planctomycetota bacterium]
MNNTSYHIRKERTAQLIVVFAILLVFLGPGCNTISPKLQDEYIRPGLSPGMCSVFDKYRKYIPKIMAEDKVPGLSLALVDRDGILWAGGFGYTDYDLKTPVTTDTMFAICSISKTITATAVMIAVQDGLLELDVPIIEYWPQFTVNSRFEENPQKKITLRHLLSHTSGIARDAPVGNAREPSYGTLEEHVLSVSDTWLRHKVGERYSYSNLGYDIAVYILEVQSSQPFAQYVEDKIFAPLNMPNCSVDPEFIRNHPNRAVGHMSHVKQLPLWINVPYGGSGSVYADAKGMAKVVQFFLNGGKVDGRAILDERLITSMLTPSIRSKDYGLGVHALHVNGNYWLGHGGGGVGFITGMYWFPEYGFGSVLLVNSETLEHSFNSVITDLIDENLVQKDESFETPSGEYQALQPSDPDAFTRFKPAWKKYVGTYKYLMSGWKFDTIVNIALAMGLTARNLHVKVFEEDGYLYVDSFVLGNDAGDFDGGRLDEYLPGLFFTPSGKCLDLRGPTLTWQNYRIKKVNNDNDRNFDLN